MFFSVREPTGSETPVVVEVPHAGLALDALSMGSIAAPVRSVVADADLYVDELYERSPALGATMLVSHASRYVCDLNRSEDDVDALAVKGGKAGNAPHGLIWRTTTEDRPALFSALGSAELERRLTQIYRPYHQTLERLLAAKRARFGFAILLCAHSMPSRGRSGHTDPGRKRADIVPGSRNWTTASPNLIRLPETLATHFGWRVAHDNPYRGGFTTAHHGHPLQGFHAVQVEISRDLYMDEQTFFKRAPGYDRTQSFCEQLVGALGATAPDPAIA